MKFKIVYYSGTGCTKYAAGILSEKLREKGVETVTERIFAGSQDNDEDFDHLILMFPIHAVNAPKRVVEYLKAMAEVSGVEAAILCTSGGGDMISNLGAIYRPCELLEKKGYRVTYENHLITPSTIIYNQREALAEELLKVLPVKLQRIADDLTAGTEFKYQRNPISRTVSRVGRLEQINAFRFGTMMRVSDRCISCGKCADLCPEGNIVMDGGKPKFSNQCSMCLGCVYGCPVDALSSLFLPKLVNRNKFDLDKLIAGAGERKPLHESRIFAYTTSTFSNARKYILQEKNKYE